jgi:hypothetical protein
MEAADIRGMAVIRTSYPKFVTFSRLKVKENIKVKNPINRLEW